MNLKYIIGYKQGYGGAGRDEKTRNAESQDEVFMFVASQSHDKSFEIKRINEYKDGKLLPYELALFKGRLVLERKAIEFPAQDTTLSANVGGDLFE